MSVASSYNTQTTVSVAPGVTLGANTTMSTAVAPSNVTEAVGPITVVCAPDVPDTTTFEVICVRAYSYPGGFANWTVVPTPENTSPVVPAPRMVRSALFSVW